MPSTFAVLTVNKSTGGTSVTASGEIGTVTVISPEATATIATSVTASGEISTVLLAVPEASVSVSSVALVTLQTVDATSGTWKTNTGATLTSGGQSTAINEATRNDSTFIYSANSDNAPSIRFNLDFATPPTTGTMTVKLAHAQSDDDATPITPSSGGSATTITIKLWGFIQGPGDFLAHTSSAITTSEGSWSLTEYTVPLSVYAGADLWGDIEFIVGGGGGSPAARRGAAISWIRLEIPSQDTSATASGAIGTVTATPPEATAVVSVSVTASGEVGEVATFPVEAEVGVEAKDTFLRVSFPTPSTSISGVQQFRILARYKEISNTNPVGGVDSARINVFLYENGEPVELISADNDIDSKTGQVITANWDASLLLNPTGAGVEVGIQGLAYLDRAIEIGAVEWAVQHGALGQTTEAYVKVGGTWKLATPYVKVSGVWKQADPYVKVSGTWEGT